MESTGLLSTVVVAAASCVSGEGSVRVDEGTAVGVGSAEVATATPAAPSATVMVAAAKPKARRTRLVDIIDCLVSVVGAPERHPPPQR
jgi:hypothetical protein